MPRRPDIPPLRRSELAPDPIDQLRNWLDLAEREVPLAQAMTLATVDSAGRPDARMVLLKGIDRRGLRFFTNQESAKGRQLAVVPEAAVVVYWRELDRQVRARGPVELLAAEESDTYFAGRLRESQLGAWASPQSEPLTDRAELDRLLERARERHAAAEIPRPPHWGGYLLRPRSVELWQGQVGRLHDRFRYDRDGAGEPGAPGEGWTITRLAP